MQAELGGSGEMEVNREGSNATMTDFGGTSTTGVRHGNTDATSADSGLTNATGDGTCGLTANGADAGGTSSTGPICASTSAGTTNSTKSWSNSDPRSTPHSQNPAPCPAPAIRQAGLRDGSRLPGYYPTPPGHISEEESQDNAVQNDGMDDINPDLENTGVAQVDINMHLFDADQQGLEDVCV